MRLAGGRLGIVGGIGVSVLALTGLAVGAVTVRAASRGHGTPTTTPPPPATVDVADESSGRVPWTQPLRLSIDNGWLEQVTVVDDRGVPLSGSLGADARTWRSAGALVPSVTYTLQLAVRDLAHHVATRAVAVQASEAASHLDATVSPGDGDVVGVGMPIVIRFNRAVPTSKRADVQDRLSVSTTPPVQGAWHWVRSTEVHWRPPTYWQPGTTVFVQSDLTRLDLGGGTWGAGRHTATFEIGDAHVSTADARAHTMTVTSNGRVVRVLPISAGRDQYPTRSGVHIALEKLPVVTMDSQTVGIPRNSPDGYYEKVYWDVRISYAGAFVHAAPWSVNDQGHRNVSHGCINLSPQDAEWFYGFARRGDVVDVLNANAPPDVADPGMADWNIPWSAWAS